MMQDNNREHRLDRDEPGRENFPPERFKSQQRVKNLYCPRDGHYCEQPSCENCMFEQQIN